MLDSQPSMMTMMMQLVAQHNDIARAATLANLALMGQEFLESVPSINIRVCIRKHNRTHTSARRKARAWTSSSRVHQRTSLARAPMGLARAYSVVGSLGCEPTMRPFYVIYSLACAPRVCVCVYTHICTTPPRHCDDGTAAATPHHIVHAMQ